MRSSTVMAAMPSFWKRSLDHMKRQTSYAIRLQGLTEPTKPYSLVQFNTPSIIDQCKAMSDKGIGGYSISTISHRPGNTPPLDLTQPSESITTSLQDPRADPPHLVFSGSISTDLPRNNPTIQRSGFAGWRTRDMGYSMFGRVLWDLGQYTYLTLRVKSDGRKYFVNIQTDSLVPTDLHQHILPTTTAGQWETITIPFGAFVRTNQGLVVEPQSEMNTMKVRSVGIALTDRIQGPFELKIAEIYASNTSSRNISRDSGFDVRQEKRTTEDIPKPKQEPDKPEEIMM